MNIHRYKELLMLIYLSLCFIAFPTTRVLSGEAETCRVSRESASMFVDFVSKIRSSKLHSVNQSYRFGSEIEFECGDIVGEVSLRLDGRFYSVEKSSYVMFSRVGDIYAAVTDLFVIKNIVDSEITAISCSGMSFSVSPAPTPANIEAEKFAVNCLGTGIGNYPIRIKIRESGCYADSIIDIDHVEKIGIRIQNGILCDVEDKWTALIHYVRILNLLSDAVENEGTH